MAKAITHFAFRNGPIEDIHANNQLSQEDMKTLNKFMVNRLAYICECILTEKWEEISFLVKLYDFMYGHDWDEATPDDGENQKLYNRYLNSNL